MAEITLIFGVFVERWLAKYIPSKHLWTNGVTIVASSSASGTVLVIALRLVGCASAQTGWRNRFTVLSLML